MKSVSDIYEKMVRENLFENDSTMVHGMKGYIVKMMCMQDGSDEEKMMDLTVQASSPEQAKSAAMKMASHEMGHKSCRVMGVDMIPNSGEELNNYGSEKDMGADDSRTAGKVMPKDVSSDLDNHDA